MKRLVYSPSIKAWIKTDSGIVDLSPYIIKCDVYRVIDNMSTAELEFRNPKVLKDNKPRFLFTERETDGKVLPVFHPMDPITIILERIAGKPIQVFTGYCDTTPDVQLFPGTAKIKASCTLKRLNHTYFDPGLQFVNDFMKAYGWNLDKSTGRAGTADTDNQRINEVNKLGDSSIGNLLYAALNEIGGWDNSNIYIQPLPSNIDSVVGKLFDEFARDNSKVNEEIVKFVKSIIGSGDYGNSSVGGGGSNTSGGDGNIGSVIDTSIVTHNNFNGSGIRWDHEGKASQFGSSHKYNYVDSGDDSYGSQGPSTGADPDVPGFALYNSPSSKTDGYDWYVILSPSGRAAALPQTDTGPNPSTGRIFDINTPAAIGVFGYKLVNGSVNFPTDSTWKGYFAGTGRQGRQRAEDIVRRGKL